MRESRIYLLNNNSIILNGNKIMLGRETYKSLDKKRSIVVLNEVLYVRRYIRKFSSNIESLIRDSFGNSEDYLFHYFYINNNKEVVIYAIKGGNNVRLLSKEARDLEVRPIQIIIIDDICKLINSNKWSLVFDFMNKYYFIKYNESLIELTLVEDELEELLNKLFSNIPSDVVYYSENIDLKIKKEGKEIEFIPIDIGEILSEKRIFKEGLFAGSIYKRLHKKG